MRLATDYNSRRYEINQCIECGTLRLTAAPSPLQQEVLRVPNSEPEFHAVLEHCEVLIRALQDQQ